MSFQIEGTQSTIDDLLAYEVHAQGIEHLGASRTTVGQLLAKAEAADMVEEITGKKRNRIYRYSQLIDLFTTEVAPEPGGSPETSHDHERAQA